jgi:hypothetical protein
MGLGFLRLVLSNSMCKWCLLFEGSTRTVQCDEVRALREGTCMVSSVSLDRKVWYGCVSHVWSRLISRIKSSCFLINLQIGIGVLALPNTLHAIGMIPGIICILASGLITTYLDTVIGTFKRGHPEVYSIADTGYVMFGRFGKELFGGMYWVRFHHQS